MVTLTESIYNEVQPIQFATLEGVAQAIQRGCKLELDVIPWDKSCELAPRGTVFLRTTKKNESGHIRVFVRGNPRVNKFQIVMENQFWSDSDSSSHVLVSGDSGTIGAAIPGICKVLDTFAGPIQLKQEIERLQKQYKDDASEFVAQLQRARPGKFEALFR